MKEQEAIKIIESELAFEPIDRDKEALKVAVKALKEIQQYRAIGTVQQCKEANAKSQEMQLLPPRTSTFTYKGICPVCGNEILISEKYCSQCGQKVGSKE